jgi:hypothetical protein
VLWDPLDWTVGKVAAADKLPERIIWLQTSRPGAVRTCRNGVCLKRFLCLSRACLGKCPGFIVSNGTKRRFVCTGDVVPVRWKVVVERLAAAQCRVAPVAELLRRGHNLRLARLADVVSEVEDPGDVRPQAAHEAIAAGSAHRDLAVPTPAHIKTYKPRNSN